MGVFLKETLTQIAVNSEHTAAMIKTLEQVSHGDIIYKRFSARNEVCFCKLDKYADLHKIESLTPQYNEEQSSEDSLKAVAKAIVEERIARRRFRADQTNVTGVVDTPAHTSVSTEAVKSASDNADCNTLILLESNVLTPSSAGSSNVYWMSSNRITRNVMTGSESQNSTPITEYDEEAQKIYQTSPSLASPIPA
ncbi:hypothetical protein MMC15_007678 [Xylographa vitiligo]|nr:hypothetical protein [Xylographa vitiligo]